MITFAYFHAKISTGPIQLHLQKDIEFGKDSVQHRKKPCYNTNNKK